MKNTSFKILFQQMWQLLAALNLHHYLYFITNNVECMLVQLSSSGPGLYQEMLFSAKLSPLLLVLLPIQGWSRERTPVYSPGWRLRGDYLGEAHANKLAGGSVDVA